MREVMVVVENSMSMMVDNIEVEDCVHIPNIRHMHIVDVDAMYTSMDANCY